MAEPQQQAQKVVPGAPPPPVLTAIDMMLREWTRVEADRLDWTYQRTEMQNKIDRLEKAVAEHERTKANLTRQLQALEFGLRQERSRNSKKAFGDLNGSSDLNSTAVHIDTSKPSDKADIAGGRNLSKKSGTGNLNKGYQTLPANLSRDLTSGNLTPGRDFLKRYLETSGYQLPGASANAGVIKPKPAAAASPAPAGSSLSVASAIGRRPSGAGVGKEDDSAAGTGDDKFALLNRKKAASVSISGVKGAPGVAGAAASAADKKPSGSGDAPSPAPSPTGGAAPAGAAPKPAPSPVAAGTPIKPDGKDAKSGVPAVAVDEKKGVLGALTDLCAKFADPKNATQWKQPLVLKSHMDGVRSVAWHDKEPVLLTASEDGTVKFWNLTQSLKDKKKKAPKPAEPQFQYMGHRGMVTSVAYRAKGQVNVFTAGVDGKVISWKLPSLKHDPYSEQGKCSAFKKCVYKHKDAVWSVCAHPTEALLFSASADGVVCAWKLDDDDSGEMTTPTRFSFAHLEPSSGERAIPTAIAPVHTDPHKIVVSYANGDVCIVDLSTGKAASIIKPPEPSDMATGSGNKHALSVATHPSLPLAISGHYDQCIRLYDLNASNSKAASCVGVVRAHRDVITSVHIEPLLGTQCATASHDQSVRFWDLGTRKVTQILEPYQTHQKKFDEGIHAVAYHPSLSCVATAGADSVVKVWGM